MAPLRRWTGLLLVCAAGAAATPPEYVSFGREQAVAPAIDPARLLRIWVVYVGQGDGIVVELPGVYAISDDATPDAPDPVFDVLIDGGAMPASMDEKIGEFLHALRPGDPVHIDLGVITHHDLDHVAGLTNLLADQGVSFGRIVHNGLASYAGGHAEIPETGSFKGVVDRKEGRIDRALGPVVGADAAEQIDPDYLILDLDHLREAFDAGEFHGVYAALAGALLGCADDGRLGAFDLVSAGDTLLALDAADAPSLRLETLWPREERRPYKSRSWGESINGNSVSFRCAYGGFSMLFTGDHNEYSQVAWRNALGGDSGALRCDVLKVPHHGSRHGEQDWFRPGDAPLAVVSVASMGSTGFGTSWKHPHDDIIQWCGGSHRFYSTHIHERRFTWDDMSAAERAAMVEPAHVLIETDGEWFRVVEVPVDGFGPGAIPDVADVHRGDGTRWIRVGGGS
jgi:beta-lactamase superfamily II metal-dependent hydrolase